jgi:hypothetical protein
MKSFFAVSMAFSIVFLSPALCLSQELQKKLQEFDKLRKGRQTDFSAAEKLGKQLLSAHGDERSQGQINYALAHFYAQTGLIHPDRAIRHARAALNCPVSIDQRLRLHVYCGDALQVANGQTGSADSRKEAAIEYLQGLSELVQFQLPEVLPKLPDIRILPSAISPQDELIRQRKIDEMVKARERAELHRQLIKHRDVLTSQLVAIYERKPFDIDELEALASTYLRDQASTDRLTAIARPAVAKAKANSQATETDLETPRYWLGWVAALLTIVTIALITSWRFKRQSS